MSVAPENIFRAVGQLTSFVEPEERTVTVFAVAGRCTGIVHPAFGEDALPLEDAVIQVQLPEAGEFAGGDVQVGRAHRRAAHVRLENGVVDAQRSEKPLA